MSANNYISIRKTKNHYEVRERDDDTDGEITDLGDFSKIEMAVKLNPGINTIRQKKCLFHVIPKRDIKKVYQYWMKKQFAQSSKRCI
jgi:hypothetical protein